MERKRQDNIVFKVDRSATGDIWRCWRLLKLLSGKRQYFHQNKQNHKTALRPLSKEG